MTNIRSADVIIIGAGAAGLMCAIEARKRRRSVLVLEHNDAPGKKIRISGGGRCNFTNLYVAPDNFVSDNPNFHKSALARYTPADFIALVNRHGIRYHEKKLGQLFCDEDSQQIITMLLEECNAPILLGCNVQTVSKGASSSSDSTKNRYVLQTNLGSFDSGSVVIATGGLSIPKMGATDFGYSIAKDFGLHIVPTHAALVPLVLEKFDFRPFLALHGISMDAIVRFERTAFRENILFTHRGISGPAALQISTYWRPGEPIHIDLAPEETGLDGLPHRFIQTWNGVYAPGKPQAQWSRRERDEFDHRLRDWAVTPSGTEGYAKAEVTAGGVDTRELSSQTMESRKAPGLYFIGEVVDVTGHLGGFNFQWAWASGFAAGQAV